MFRLRLNRSENSWDAPTFKEDEVNCHANRQLKTTN